ncbi:unnamed protein product, partial [Prorocentrum cordatum]
MPRTHTEVPCADRGDILRDRPRPPSRPDPRCNRCPCYGQREVSSYQQNISGAWLERDKCASRLDCAPKKGFSGNYRSQRQPEVVQQVLDEMIMGDLEPTATSVRHLIKKHEQSKRRGRCKKELGKTAVLPVDATHLQPDGPRRDLVEKELGEVQQVKIQQSADRPGSGRAGSGSDRGGRGGSLKSFTTKQQNILRAGVLAMGRAITGLVGSIMKVSTQPRADFAEACCSPTTRLTTGMMAEGFECQRLNLERGCEFHATESTEK